MAPTAFQLAHSQSGNFNAIQHISRSLSFLYSRATDANSIPPLASVFALVVRQHRGVAPRSLDLLPQSTHLDTSSPITDVFHPALTKRQSYILAIPTTYQGLNDGPAPGAIAGIVLGSIAGFILVLYVVLSLMRLYTGRTFVETKIVERRDHHHHSRSRSRHSRSMSEAPRRTVRETTVIEESRVRERERDRSRDETEVIVEEDHDDVVEVIEEHSPERRGTGRSKRTSGFRTVDPAEFGGGNRPMRKVSRR